MVLDNKLDYDDRFTDKNKKWFKEKGYNSDFINRYDNRYDIDDIRHFLFCGRNIKLANIRSRKKNPYIKCIDFDIVTPEMANSFAQLRDEDGEYVSAYWIVDFLRIGESVEKYINGYNGKFSPIEIFFLLEAGCSEKDAMRYPLKLGGSGISILYGLQMYPENWTIEDMEFVLGTYGGNIDTIEAHFQYFSRNIRRFRFLSRGSNGVILVAKGTLDEFDLAYLKAMKKVYTKDKDFTEIHVDAYEYAIENVKENMVIKITNDMEKELEFMNKFVGSKKKIKNIIKYLGTVGPPLLGIRYEYIKGSCLQEIINNNPMPKKKVLKYTSHILNGLLEMREAGIYYHRDIRPANIMLDEKKDRAVIIDLGIATTNPNAPQIYNRRYGSSVRANDLVSLGQVMYKMVTGDHIFAESKSMEMTINAHNIKDERDKVYADETKKRLESYLTKVDDNVNDRKIRNIIDACLVSEPEDHYKIRKMF